MVPIFIDTATLAEEFNLSAQDTENLLEFVVKDATFRLSQTWMSLAGQNLHQTRENYINSIIVGDEGRFVGTVTLVGALNNMIEGGASPWDMKLHFMTGPAAKQKKDGGWYTTIPFQFATAQALGESTIFSGKMPSSIEQAVKAKPFKRDSLGVEKTDPLTFGELPQQYQARETHRVAIPQSKEFLEYKRKTAQHEGIIRIKNPTSKKTSSSYVSFRRVSDKSDANAWIHPGFKPLNLGMKAVQELNLPNVIGNAIDNALSNLGFS